MNSPQHLIPFELDCLTNAHRYQEWMISAVRPHLGKKILELGAGIGNMSKHLPSDSDLILTEVDTNLLNILREVVKTNRRAEVIQAHPDRPIEAFIHEQNIDTILSFNVFEHVEKDWILAKNCIEFLKNQKTSHPKRLVTVVPAHPFAYGEIDKSFKHFRRYSSRSFLDCLKKADSNLDIKKYYSRYMNIPGLIAWVLRGKILKKNSIGKNSIETFEKICPIIRPVDELIHQWLKLPLGNSLIEIYEIDSK
jgi:phospholipid N-methyltransferase